MDPLTGLDPPTNRCMGLTPLYKRYMARLRLFKGLDPPNNQRMGYIPLYKGNNATHCLFEGSRPCKESAH